MVMIITMTMIKMMRFQKSDGDLVSLPHPESAGFVIITLFILITITITIAIITTIIAIIIIIIITVIMMMIIVGLQASLSHQLIQNVRA